MGGTLQKTCLHSNPYLRSSPDRGRWIHTMPPRNKPLSAVFPSWQELTEGHLAA